MQGSSDSFVDFADCSFELGALLGFDRFKFDGDLFARDDVDAEIDVSEGAGSNLLADSVLASHTKIHGRHSPEVSDGGKVCCAMRMEGKKGW